MLILSNNDLYKVRLNSLIAGYDRTTIINLYQPIIGAIAMSLYFTFECEAENQKIMGSSIHENLLIRTSLSVNEFLKARKLLEAVGLLKSYISKSGDYKLYEYEVFAPKTPKAFIDDVLLYGMLTKYVGEKEARRLKSIYALKECEPEGNEISSTFIEIFHPDFNDPSFSHVHQDELLLGRKVGKIDAEFNYDHFFEALLNAANIKQNAFTKKEVKEIERFATLYGVDEMNMASVISKVYNPGMEKGKRVDFSKVSIYLQNESTYSFLNKNKTSKKDDLSHRVSSETDMAKKINMMESESPIAFLKVLQDNIPPASSDMRLIQTILDKYKLTFGVTNVLIEYVLNKNNNVLSRALMEKIAVSLAREKITTAIDAMNYFKKVRKSKTTQEQVKYGGGFIRKDDKIEVLENQPQVVEEEIIDRDELLEGLE